MKYLIIDEDGGMEQSNKEPDQELLERVEGAGVKLLRCEHGVFQEAVIERLEAEGDDEEDEYGLDWEAV